MKNKILELCMKEEVLLDVESFGVLQDLEDSDFIEIALKQIKQKKIQGGLELLSFLKSFRLSREKDYKKSMNHISENSKQQNFSDEIKNSTSLGLSESEGTKSSTSLGLSESEEKDSESQKLNYNKIKDKEINKEDFQKKGNLSSQLKVSFFNREPKKGLGVKDFVKMYRGRFNFFKELFLNRPTLKNIISIDKLNNNRGASLIGMVYNKRKTKMGNLLLTIEDLTGRVNLIINKGKKDLFKIAEEVSLDSVIAIKGSGNRKVFFVNELFFPDSFLDERKFSKLDEEVAFISDLHFGSKKFLKGEFSNFIDFLNNKNSNLKSDKIKYLFIGGDLVAGVGVYPNQEEDLEIKDLEKQFLGLAGFLEKIRGDIKIIISPGNHDGVSLMEPQPLFDEKYSWPIYNLKNVIMVGNPSTINLGCTKDFSGFDILSYHGFSFPFFANNIPRLSLMKAMNFPNKIMEEILKNRHLSPTAGSAQYFPLEKESNIIYEIPDIFFSGHTHKSGVSYYNNILVISGSSWESKTSYQEKFGNEPDHCKIPIFNLKTRKIRILDFEEKDENKR